MRIKNDISDFVSVDTEQAVRDGIAIRFKERRKEAKLTQSDLSRKSGVSLGSIRRFEQLGEISLGALLSLSSVLGNLSEFKELFNKTIITNIKDMK